MATIPGFQGEDDDNQIYRTKHTATSIAMESFESALTEATNPTKRDLLGAIGLVVDKTGKVLYHHAAGNQSLAPSSSPLDPDSTVTLGSAGKFITHIAALQCVERKLLGLDDPVAQWLPELDSLQVIEASEVEPGFVLRPPVTKITLRHLLTHTSGLGGADEPLVETWRASPAGVAHAAATADAHIIVKLFAHPLLFEPGAGYCYGGSIYFTQLLVSRITGQPMGEYVQANVFTALGMDKSTMLPQIREDVRAKLIQMVERTPEGLVVVEEETRDVTVSVHDLGVLLADLIAPTSKILNPENVNLLFAPQFEKGSKALADLRGDKGDNYVAPLNSAVLPSPVEVDGVPTIPVWNLEGKGLVLNWTLAALLVEGAHGLPLGMPAGTLTWNGMPNVVWAMHRERGIAMVFATQLVPVDDEKVIKVQMEFFKEEDPAFLNALDATVLPGDVPADNKSDSDDPEPPPPGQSSLKRRRYDGPEPVDEVIYGPSGFGEFGQYMNRKRAKLQIQNSEITTTAETQIFKGISVYVNGWTSPSVQEIRSLLVRNGGVFEPYLDKKSLVTHIVTCALTEAKMREFKNMKVVRPEWLTESVKAGTLLPWRDFIFVQGARPVNTQMAPPPAQIPRYAADASNPNAQRVMANPEWRSAHTSAAPGFVKGYYEHSRLHFMSATKAELVLLVREAHARAEANKEQKEKENMALDAAPDSPMKGKGRAGEERVIMHCDFDCFFVAAGLVSRPELRGKPVVVCHSQGTQGGSSSTSEIACASYEAREFGIKNGMSLQQARQLCSTVLTMPYEFDRYKDFALKFYTVLMSHADDIQAVSIDEALIDVTTAVSRLRSAAARAGSPHDPAKDFAEHIRSEVRQATQCEISIGVAHNILLARLATRRAKPAGALHVLPADVPALMATLQITDLWGFASSSREKALEKLGSTALSDLAKKSRGALSEALGKKTGEKLYDAIRGIDDTQLSSDKPRKSVSAEINYGIRFESNEAAEIFIFDMAGTVETRLNEATMLGRSITLKIMKRDPSAPVEPPKFLGHGHCEVFNKQTPLVGPGGRATSDAKVIGEHAWRILKSFNFDPKELRGIGIQIQKLEPAVGPVNTDAYQRTLPFKPDGQARHPPVAPPPPPVPVRAVAPADKLAGPSTDISLPAIEEVDPAVLEALPLDVRKELEDEWRRRSESPFPGKAPPPPVQHAPRAPSRPPPVVPQRVLPQQKFDKPTRMQQSGLRLPPRSGSGYVIDKKSIHPNRPPNSFLRPTEADLRDLNIDPEVFAGLPRAVQREQLTGARLIKTMGAIPEVSGERLILKPRKYVPPPDLFRQPPPYAKYPERPKLRQQGRKGEKLFFTEADDVQGVLEAWVNAFKKFPPEARDIEFFAKFLVQSVDSERSSDTGVERAIAIVKWWLVLLRRYWGDYEHFEAVGYDAEDATVAEAWWKAFRDVKDRIDIVARKKFGGNCPSADLYPTYFTPISHLVQNTL
ncbi:hypothetical protein B0H19DRAFT_1273095 [Mycena capillaripes]|nr:hypothetical protein B0H19DRAFT_1273095 [Mycena capillaripes]